LGGMKKKGEGRGMLGFGWRILGSYEWIIWLHDEGGYGQMKKNPKVAMIYLMSCVGIWKVVRWMIPETTLSMTFLSGILVFLGREYPRYMFISMFGGMGMTPFGIVSLICGVLWSHTRPEPWMVYGLLGE
jgi:hypothetical protein